MQRWILNGSVKTPNGKTIDEVKCPVCGYCETIATYKRHTRCYVCGTPLEWDEKEEEE